MAGQNKVATFSVATGGKYTTKDGREVDDTAWHNIVAWRASAEIVEKYIKKGSQVFIIGHLSYRKYNDKDGVERNITDIVVDKIELLGGKAESSPAPQKFDPHAVQTTPMPTHDDSDPSDDLPW
jgi:single-strand DNA-binding protein